jgi:hypothetical protein
MNIIGVDCVTQDKKVGVALGRLTPTCLGVLDVYDPHRSGSVLEYLVKSYVLGEPTLLALDAPLGWPARLCPALVGHTAGDHIAIKARTSCFDVGRTRVLKRSWTVNLSMSVRIESQGPAQCSETPERPGGAPINADSACVESSDQRDCGH